jgi:5-amino-6-(5-phosphoribosylamino)uracil reductase
MLRAANMICSVDGASAHDGRSAGLGAAGDHAVFAALRGLSDVVLVGSHTVAAEDYHAVSTNPQFRTWRARRCRRSTPAVTVVSTSLNLDPTSAVFGTPMAMVFTAHDAPRDKREALNAAGVKVISCGDEAVDLSLAFEFLSGMGLWRVLVEGGPTLLGQLTEEDLLDELCLTVSPTLIRGGAGRIVATSADATLGMRPAHVLTDEENYRAGVAPDSSPVVDAFGQSRRQQCHGEQIDEFAAVTHHPAVPHPAHADRRWTRVHSRPSGAKVIAQLISRCPRCDRCTKVRGGSWVTISKVASRPPQSGMTSPTPRSCRVGSMWRRRDVPHTLLHEYRQIICDGITHYHRVRFPYAA